MKVLYLEGCGKLTSKEYKQTKRNDTCVVYKDFNGDDRYGIIQKFEAISNNQVFAVISSLTEADSLAPHIHKIQNQL